RAVGLFGDEIGLHAVQIPPLGRVGDPLPSRPRAVVEALAAGGIPVVAPLGVGPLNVNADDAAAALAVGLEAERLLFVTDVVGLGHCHPAPLAAAQVQLDRLWHVSNLYWTEPMVELAHRLSARAGGARAFFCNSGTEAVEAGLKYARKASGKPGAVALSGSFHGRTLGALSVTGQPGKRAAFEPLLPHVQFADPNDVASLEAAISAETGCILLEPIQGEGGVHVLEAAFVAAARHLANE